MDIFAMFLIGVVVEMAIGTAVRESGFFGYVRWGLYGSLFWVSTDEALTAEIGMATAMGLAGKSYRRLFYDKSVCFWRKCTRNRVKLHRFDIKFRFGLRFIYTLYASYI